MTFNACGPTYQHGVAGGFDRSIETTEDVRTLVALLGEEGVFTAVLEGEHAVIDAHVENGLGYLLFNGQEITFGYSVGLSTSPAVLASETQFPAGSGVPLDMFTTALIEFLNTDRLPTSIRWSDLEPDDWPPPAIAADQSPPT
jgi:hypothetical protein